MPGLKLQELKNTLPNFTALHVTKKLETKGVGPPPETGCPFEIEACLSAPTKSRLGGVLGPKNVSLKDRTFIAAARADVIERLGEMLAI